MNKPNYIKGSLKTYKLLEQVGNGGNSIVFKAEDDDGEFYAIKFLESDKKERFKKERYFQMECESQYIANIVDFGEAHSQTGEISFYVMNYFDKTFKNIINDSIISFNEKLKYFIKVCECVRFIHNKGIIHRDIKPENILFNSKTDRICIADFGIAHFPNSTLTKTGERLANFNYAAPEQKIKNGKITKAVDIYALGLILNQIFTGIIPNGDNYKKIKETHPHFASLDQVVNKMIRFDPKERECNLTTIIAEIKLITKLISEERNDIIHLLKFKGDSSERQLIIDKAVEDILYANQLLYINENLAKFNYQYHKEIIYIPTELMKGSKLLSDINVALNSKWKYENTNFCDNLINPYRNLIVTELTTDEQYDSFRKILLSIKCYKDINFLKNETLRLFSQLKSYHAYEFLRTTEKIIDLNNNASYTLFEAAKLLDDFCNKQIIDRKDVSIGASFMIDLDHSIKKDCDNKLYAESLSEIKKRENIIEIEKYFKNISIIHFGTLDYCFFETAKAKNTFKTFIKECVDKYNSINEIDKADFNDILSLIDCCGEYIEIDSFFLGKISDELKKQTCDII